MAERLESNRPFKKYVMRKAVWEIQLFSVWDKLFILMLNKGEKSAAPDPL